MIHVLVDSYGCSTQRLDNLMDVYESLNKIINVMRLKSIMPPQLIPYYYCKNLEDVGISAFVLLKGGHLTIHTFPQLGCYFLDVLYDGFASAELLEKLLKKEFPCDAFFIKRIDREEFDKSDMGMYDIADFGPHYMISTKLNHVPTLDEFSDKLDRIPYEVTKVIDQKHVFIRGYNCIAVGEPMSNEWELISDTSKPEVEVKYRYNHWYRVHRDNAGRVAYTRMNLSFGIAEKYYCYEL